MLDTVRDAIKKLAELEKLLASAKELDEVEDEATEQEESCVCWSCGGILK